MIGRLVLVATMLLFSGALHIGVLGLWPRDPDAKRAVSLAPVVIKSGDALFGEAILPVSVLAPAVGGRPVGIQSNDILLPVGEIPPISPTLDASRVRDAAVDREPPASPSPLEPDIDPVSRDRLGQLGNPPLPVLLADVPVALTARAFDTGIPAAADFLASTAVTEATEFSRLQPGTAASLVAPFLPWEDGEESSLVRIGAPVAAPGAADETAKVLPTLAVDGPAGVINIPSIPESVIPSPGNVLNLPVGAPEEVVGLRPSAATVSAIGEASNPLSASTPPLPRLYGAASATAEASIKGEASGDRIAPSEEKEYSPALAPSFEPAAFPSIVMRGQIAMVPAVEPLFYDEVVEPAPGTSPKDAPVLDQPPTRSSDTRHSPVPASLARYLQEIRSEVARVRSAENRPRVASGTAVVAAVIRLDGTLLETRLAASSGHQLLDRIAIDRVRRAAPFAPVPVSAEYRAVTVRVPITFSGQSTQR